MRNALLAVCMLAGLALGLCVAFVANHNHALGEEVLRIERSNQDLVVAIEELDSAIWQRGFELDARTSISKTNAVPAALERGPVQFAAPEVVQ